MKKCILCKNDELISYGDNVFGEIFCRSCFNDYSCVNCHRMNLSITIDYNNNPVVDIKKFYGLTVANDSVLSSMFQPGYKFRLYCKGCWDSQVMYEDESSVEPEEDDLDSYYSDNECDENEEEENLNSYYTGKGRYDLY